jgi:hypothetical protein
MITSPFGGQPLSKTPAGGFPPPASLLYQLSYGNAEAIPAGLEPATARLLPAIPENGNPLDR